MAINSRLPSGVTCTPVGVPGGRDQADGRGPAMPEIDHRHVVIAGMTTYSRRPSGASRARAGTSRIPRS